MFLDELKLKNLPVFAVNKNFSANSLELFLTLCRVLGRSGYGTAVVTPAGGGRVVPLPFPALKVREKGWVGRCMQAELN